ncbi:MAG TPA: hypothetical protein VML96_11175 [Egibacteraceae bacterium]|nr:hypothetical protein [Egibacteraceae bacterium]
MADPASEAVPFPRVPAHAWAWLQRSRPVLAEVSARLEGRPPASGCVDRLRERCGVDPFTRDLVIAVIAEVAFSGRVPTRRPAGASWDRGLTWWAAAITGATPGEYEARGVGPAAVQRPLFDEPDRPAGAAAPGAATARWAPPPGPEPVRRVSAERAGLIRDLRELLQAAEGDQVPVSAIRALLDRLEGS